MSWVIALTDSSVNTSNVMTSPPFSLAPHRDPILPSFPSSLPPSFLPSFLSSSFLLPSLLLSDLDPRTSTYFISSVPSISCLASALLCPVQLFCYLYFVPAVHVEPLLPSLYFIPFFLPHSCRPCITFTVPASASLLCLFNSLTFIDPFILLHLSLSTVFMYYLSFFSLALYFSLAQKWQNIHTNSENKAESKGKKSTLK